jgi:hypothetical protein
MTRSTQLVNIAPCWSRNGITIFFAMESWTLVLMDQVIISWSIVWTALPLVCRKTVLSIQHNDHYHSTSSTNSFLWEDYQIFCTEMERMPGIDCQKGNFLANHLSRPERVLSKTNGNMLLYKVFFHFFSLKLTTFILFTKSRLNLNSPRRVH